MALPLSGYSAVSKTIADRMAIGKQDFMKSLYQNVEMK